MSGTKAEPTHTDPKEKPVKHTLTANGDPFDEMGEPLDKSAPIGRAKCACGWLSDEVETRAARKAAHAEHKADPGDDPQGVTEVEYTKAKIFFRPFGVDGAATLAGTYDGISNVDGKNGIVLVAGSLTARQAVAAALPLMWDSVYESFKAWKREQREQRKEWYKTGEGRKAMFQAESEFLLGACEKYAADQAVL